MAKQEHGLCSIAIYHRIPLRILCESYIKESKLHFYGRLRIRKILISYLSNWLLIHNEIKCHPEILQEPISRPLFIVSLPRTGTSLLHWLLSQDPSNRSPLYWETIRPAPAPEPLTRETDPRIEEVEKLLGQRQKIAPGLASKHKVHAMKPNECFPLLMNTLVYPSWQTISVP